MTPYVISEELITEALLEDRALAEEFLGELPDPEPNHPACPTIGRGTQEPKTYWSCHGLVRAFAKMRPEWKVADGYFVRKGTQHSWLWRFTPDGMVFLDLYPVGGVFPTIVDGSHGSPWRDLYMECSYAYRPNERELWEKQADYALSLIDVDALLRGPVAPPVIPEPAREESQDADPEPEPFPIVEQAPEPPLKPPARRVRLRVVELDRTPEVRKPSTDPVPVPRDLPGMTGGSLLNPRDSLSKPSMREIFAREFEQPEPERPPAPQEKPRPAFDPLTRYLRGIGKKEA